MTTNSPKAEPQQQPESASIFRDEALAYISTPNDVNKVITVVGPGTWVLIWTFFIILFLALGWLFFGSIPITLQGQGILIPKGGIFKSITAPDGLNTITDLKVKTGQIIQKDQVVAILDNPETSKLIESRTTYIADLKKKKDDIDADATKSLKEKKENHDKLAKIIKERLESKTEYTKHLADHLAKEKELLKKGYTKNQNILDSESQLNALVSEELHGKEQLVQLEKEMLTDQEVWTQKKRDIALKLADEERDLDNLKIRLETARILKSPSQGKVISINRKVGDKTTANDTVITLSQGDDSQLEGLIYLNPLEGKEVKVGMIVYMIPTYLEKEHVGYIEGEIIQISPYPETAKSLMSTLQNEELVKKFTETSPPISARVAFKPNRDADITRMGKLSPGTWVYGRVVVQNRSPFAIIIPEMKKFIEMTP